MNNRRFFQISAVVFASAALLAGCGGGGGTPARSGSQVQVAPAPSESTARHGAVYSYRVNNGEQWLLNYHGSEGTAASAQSSALAACNALENAQDCRVEFTYAIAPPASSPSAPSQPSTPSQPETPSQPATPSQPSAPSGSNVRYGAIYSYTVNDSAVYSYTMNAEEPVVTRTVSYHGNETTAAKAYTNALAACNALPLAQNCRVELIYWTAVPVTPWTGVRTGGDADGDGNGEGDADGDGNGEGDADGDGNGEGDADGDSNIINSNFKYGFIIYGYSPKPGTTRSVSDSYAKDGDEYANRWLEITYSAEAQTFSEARSPILSRCASNINPCYILANFSNCAALAQSDDSLVKAYGTANSEEEARSDALAECSRLGGSGCGTTGSICRLDQIGDRPATTPVGGFQRGGFNVCNTVDIFARLRPIVRYGAVYLGTYESHLDVPGGLIIPYFNQWSPRPLRSRTEARNAALADCRSRGLLRCSIKTTFTGCAAFATVGFTPGSCGDACCTWESFFSTGDTLASARTSVMAKCRRFPHLGRRFPYPGRTNDRCLCFSGDESGSATFRSGCNQPEIPQCR